MTNPLISSETLLPFSKIRADHFEPAMIKIIEENREKLADLLAQEDYNWDSLLQPLEEMEERLSRAWSPICHLKTVKSLPEIRAAYEVCQKHIVAWNNELSQNAQLFQAVDDIANSANFQSLSKAQQATIKHMLRDFRLAGVHLSEEKKAEYRTLTERLSENTTKFSNHVMDATYAWVLKIENEDELSGIPEETRARARERAEEKNEPGWHFTLEAGDYVAIMSYADDREIRKKMHWAYNTRASDEGPSANQFDNSQLIGEILSDRHALATLVGFKNYGLYSLAPKMANSCDEVLSFLKDLAQQVKPKADEELRSLQDFAEKDGFSETLAPWDIAYFSEKQREALFQINDEALRVYFPLDKVFSGLFDIVNQLYGLKVSEKKDVDVWDDQVRFFEIFDEAGVLRGQFYADLFARPNKQGGAWMDEVATRVRFASGEAQTPVAHLICNFSAPAKSKPTLLRHDDVETVFHEFGHCLHHLLTKIEVPSVSGISGVPWDAVELPSQFMENFLWEKETLPLFSEHFETKAPLPESVISQLRASKNFQAAMLMLRQIEFSLFDFEIHSRNTAASTKEAAEILQDIRQQWAVMPAAEYARFQHAFTHIFSGGYAAGYYSYLWAEVLSADAYAMFKENGVLNREVGTRFCRNILECGGSEPIEDLYIAFRGKAWSHDALLEQRGLV